MKKFLIGLIVGLILGGGMAWAAATWQVKLTSADGTAISASNPLPIEVIP